ncbi:GIY-YIG nuclease family protein [Phenylobacterium soli]|uniref:hypothetical protein n=1 Tax=Phenylobacterium soli TaxID=2170551 RepID=UPI0010580549|nr:hypothetical protein [Phenylobacterium soli]
MIYGLTDPVTGELRYIGKANDATQRFGSHLRDMDRRRTPLYDWMKKLRASGRSPALVIIEECAGDWREAERRLISEARARGARLLNVADGGDEPYCPPEVRSENGRRAVRRFLGKEPHGPGKLTREDLVIDTLEWMLRFWRERDRPTRAAGVLLKMRQCYAADPDAYGRWANV